jgi:transcriptional regulator with XRE-family HTH domain
MTARTRAAVVDTETRMRLLIRDRLTATGTSQRALAERINRSQSTISQTLSGHRRLSFEMADDMLTALGYRIRVDLEEQR